MYFSDGSVNGQPVISIGHRVMNDSDSEPDFFCHLSLSTADQDATSAKTLSRNWKESRRRPPRLIS